MTSSNDRTSGIWDNHRRGAIGEFLKEKILPDSDPLRYLTAIFNSSLFRCCFKDNFPNLGEDRRELRKIFFNKIQIKKPNAMIAALFEKLVDHIQFVKTNANKAPSNSTPPAVIATFIEEVIDACVMEIYFADHMAEKRLTVIAEVDQMIRSFNNNTSTSVKWQQVQSFYATTNAPKHPVRNRLMRIPIDSPDLLRVIKEEGKV